MKNIDILKALLASFDTRLTTLEKSTKEHLSTIESTFILTKAITSTCIYIQSNLKQRHSKESSNSLRKTLPSSLSNKKLNLTKNRSKTPLKSRNGLQNQLNKHLTKDIMTTRSTQSKLMCGNSIQSNIINITY